MRCGSDSSRAAHEHGRGDKGIVAGDLSWLVNGRGTRCARATQRILEAAGIDPPISGAVADNQTLLDLVAAGQAVTIVPDLLLHESRTDIMVACEDLAISRTIVAVTRTMAAASAAAVVDKLRGKN